MSHRVYTLFVAALLPLGVSVAQGFSPNYDEAQVPEYDLPDPLRMEDGRPVDSPQQWWDERRPEVLGLFEDHVYGRAPSGTIEVRVEEVERGSALDGAAVRRQIDLHLAGKQDGPLRLLLFVPAEREGPVPAFLGLNFGGNQAICDDPAVPLSTRWMRYDPERGVVDHRATEASRNSLARRWPAARIVERGYALVTLYYGDIDPDFDDGFQNGVHPLFQEDGEQVPPAGEWGSIGAWAWGLSRVMDYLEQDEAVDAGAVSLLGHSRLGKTALWAGARDPRFAIVISNNSGCGGAALSKRRFGETVARINQACPHWFCDAFTRYDDREETLPIDQHQLVALIAPRPVLICSAVQDTWADPLGEFLAAKGADPVYRLLGTDGLAAEEMPTPALDQLITSTVGYRIRPGEHDVTAEDWEAYMDFADRHLGGEDE